MISVPGQTRDAGQVRPQGERRHLVREGGHFRRARQGLRLRSGVHRRFAYSIVSELFFIMLY